MPSILWFWHLCCFSPFSVILNWIILTSGWWLDKEILDFSKLYWTLFMSMTFSGTKSHVEGRSRSCESHKLLSGLQVSSTLCGAVWALMGLILVRTLDFQNITLASKNTKNSRTQMQTKALCSGVHKAYRMYRQLRVKTSSRPIKANKSTGQKNKIKIQNP